MLVLYIIVSILFLLLGTTFYFNQYYYRFVLPLQSSCDCLRFHNKIVQQTYTDLGQVLYLQLPVRFGVKLRYSILSVVGSAYEYSRGLEGAL